MGRLFASADGPLPDHTARVQNGLCDAPAVRSGYKDFAVPAKKKGVLTDMINNEFITFTIGKQKTIALIAHDGKKQELIEWCEENREILRKHFLCGTGTTARLVAERTGLPVKGYNSGPLGGDQQIGAKIVEGAVNFVVFFSDPLEAQPHDPDVKALLRIAQVYDIPIANNKATADFMIHSPLMDQEYEHQVINFRQNIIDRVNHKDQLMK